VTTRSYGEACLIAHGLDLVGERWALLIARELALGPRRFTDLRAGLPAIAPNVLTQRLQELEHAGVIERRKLPPPAAAWVYELTEWGRELEPILMAIGTWAARAPAPPASDRVSAVSLILSLRGSFDAARAAGVDSRVRLQIEGEVYDLQIGGGRLEVARGPVGTPDLVITANPSVLAAIIARRDDAKHARTRGDLVLEGDAKLFKRFVGLFEPYGTPRRA
jgi:DNA-binding HxlR family transcriptional regulator